ALEEGAGVEVLFVEPDFYGIRTAGKGVAFVPARAVRLLPGPVATPAAPRPRREILPQINELPPASTTPGAGPTPSPPPGATPVTAR
ncbi:MAG TPA: hypothetical protein PK598_14420, partial [Thermoanaerobaculia bacterium]|nr:hypothetical protein [Thermoanaerobaculia bacterium]